MLNVRWTASAIRDMARFHDFLAAVNPDAARALVLRLKAAPQMLIEQPRLGSALPGFAPRELRRLVLGAYELRYQLGGEEVVMLRVWHTREDR